MTQIAVWVLALFLAAGSAAAQLPGSQQAPIVKVSLVSETATVSPGQSFLVAVRQKISPGWHTYWINPGDAGEAMTLAWQMPDGFKAGEIQWPLPEVQPVASLTNYGYSGEAWFLVRMDAPADLSGERVTLSAVARWLTCEKVCVPEEGTVSLTLPVAAAGGAVESSQAGPIREHAARLPVNAPWASAFLLGKERLRLDVKGIGAAAGDPAKLRFFPLEWGQIDNSAPQRASLSGGNLSFDLQRGDVKDQTFEELKGLLVIGEGSGRKGYWIAAKSAGLWTDEKRADVVPVKTEGGGPLAGSPSAPGAPSGGGIGFLTAVLFAVLGGIILNLMPCVFPVLSLKVLSLAKYANGAGEAARRQGLAYFAGVMASFAVLAALLLSLRAAGGAAGWGFQFQSPEFVLAMTVVFFALGLSLSGVFSFGGSLMGAGDALTRQSGLSGSFFTGVLAVVVATPCTAPFMGAALGYALTREAAEATAILLALGLGFASPMVALTVSPALRRLLPKPGAWMETLKQLMAFPLYASAGWLVWVLSIERGSDGVLASVIALLGVGYAAWLAGRMQNAGGVSHWLLRAGVAATVLLYASAGSLIWMLIVERGGMPASVITLLGVGFAAWLARLLRNPDGALRWLLPAGVAAVVLLLAAGHLGAAPAAKIETAPAGAFGEPFTPERLEALRGQGKAVFVNMTAAWCITCKANEYMGLSSERVRAEFARRNIAYLKGDWTNKDPRITAVLQAFNRAGVPLYLLYPPKSSGEAPAVLPQLLTESIVLDHIAQLPVAKAEGDLPHAEKR